ncbi:CTD phosphatase Fcp1 [Dispira parvispora]|uniref:RNA polymerase II subunit A C-terminal domain phosphatase n=1 Tax=Dispira parvispora TaxID=1520584 RepID=A0A9W8AZ78_9FUNG|nr:CTD phosphatase Fcp1 [Dispira parvispora]
METLRDVTIPDHHLPATIISFKVPPPEGNKVEIEKRTPLCIYEHHVMEPPTDDETEDEEEDTTGTRRQPSVTDFKLKKFKPLPPIRKTRREILFSPWEGALEAIRVSPGDIISSPSQKVLSIKEPCNHAVQYFGQCAICGKDLSYIDYTGRSDTARATISMTHDTTGLTVSQSEAERLEQQNTKRLLEERRLSLIVDLDQTIIHANATREPLTDWLKHCPTEVREDVGSFQLAESPLLYYIKLRPKLRAFLKRVTELYELHIYTMGTRPYAEKVAELIDPQKHYFKERILSRDESGSITHKNIQRLFPCDNSMVVAIDDRVDVWQNSPNLIKVKPFTFFTGIGDINAGFLPKATLPTLPEAPPAVPGTETKAEVEPNDSTATSTEAATEESPTTTGKSSTDKKSAGEPTSDESKSPKSESPKLFKHPFEDADDELLQVLQRLEEIHRRFYEAYDAQTQGRKVPNPDVSVILPEMKHKVLAGVHLVFSSVIPLQMNPRQSDIWQWARSFGAQCSENITRFQAGKGGRKIPRSAFVTHVVAGKPDTAKVQEARRIEGVKIVRIDWLIDSLHAWKHLDESSYQWPFSKLANKRERSLQQPAEPSVTEGTQDAEAESPPEDVLHSVETWSTQSEAGDTSNDNDSFSSQSEGGEVLHGDQPSDYLSDALPEEVATNIDWAEAEKELMEFIGTDDEEDEDEGSEDHEHDNEEAEDYSATSLKRTAIVADDDSTPEELSGDESESLQPKKRKRAESDQDNHSLKDLSTQSKEEEGEESADSDFSDLLRDMEEELHNDSDDHVSSDEST